MPLSCVRDYAYWFGAFFLAALKFAVGCGPVGVLVWGVESCVTRVAWNRRFARSKKKARIPAKIPGTKQCPPTVGGRFFVPTLCCGMWVRFVSRIVVPKNSPQPIIAVVFAWEFSSLELSSGRYGSRCIMLTVSLCMQWACLMVPF